METGSTYHRRRYGSEPNEFSGYRIQHPEHSYRMRRRDRRERRLVWSDVLGVFQHTFKPLPKVPTKFTHCIKCMYRHISVLAHIAFAYFIISSSVFYVTLGYHLRDKGLYMVYHEMYVFHVSHSFIILLPVMTYWLILLMSHNVRRLIRVKDVHLYLLLTLLALAGILVIYNSCGIANLHYSTYKLKKRKLHSMLYYYDCLDMVKDFRESTDGYEFSYGFAEHFLIKTACCSNTGAGKNLPFETFRKKYNVFLYASDGVGCCSRKNCDDCTPHSKANLPRFCLDYIWNIIADACAATCGSAFLYGFSYLVLILAYIIHHGKMVDENPASPGAQEELDHPFFLVRKTKSDLRRRQHLTKALSPILRRTQRHSLGLPKPMPNTIREMPKDDDEVYRVRFRIDHHGNLPRRRDGTSSRDATSHKPATTTQDVIQEARKKREMQAKLKKLRKLKRMKKKENEEKRLIKLAKQRKLSKNQKEALKHINARNKKRRARRRRRRELNKLNAMAKNGKTHDDDSDEPTRPIAEPGDDPVAKVVLAKIAKPGEDSKKPPR